MLLSMLLSRATLESDLAEAAAFLRTAALSFKAASNDFPMLPHDDDALQLFPSSPFAAASNDFPMLPHDDNSHPSLPPVASQQQRTSMLSGAEAEQVLRHGITTLHTSNTRRLRFVPGTLPTMTKLETMRHCRIDRARFREHFPPAPNQVAASIAAPRHNLTLLSIAKSGSSSVRHIMATVFSTKGGTSLSKIDPDDIEDQSVFLSTSSSSSLTCNTLSLRSHHLVNLSLVRKSVTRCVRPQTSLSLLLTVRRDVHTHRAVE